MKLACKAMVILVLLALVGGAAQSATIVLTAQVTAPQHDHTVTGPPDTYVNITMSSSHVWHLQAGAAWTTYTITGFNTLTQTGSGSGTKQFITNGDGVATDHTAQCSGSPSILLPNGLQDMNITATTGGNNASPAGTTFSPASGGISATITIHLFGAA